MSAIDSPELQPAALVGYGPRAEGKRTPVWIRRTLLAAGVYNLLWGAVAVLAPEATFRWCGMEPPRYPELWQCIGMIVGVYGVGYVIAAFDPVRHWPIVLVGLLGKVLGPLGMAHALWTGALPWRFAFHSVFNDLLWWAPFALALWHARRDVREARRACAPGAIAGSAPGRG